MAKETCPNCNVKITVGVSFCPSCERPTRHANDSERLEWDLKQWRAHVDRSVAAGANPGSTMTRYAGVVTVAEDRPPAPIARVPMVSIPAPSVPSPVERPVAREPAPVVVPEEPGVVAAPEKARRRAPRIHMPRPRIAFGKKERAETPVVIDLDADHEFAYRACATCHATDWIVRTSKNDDGTWNYWCVRCSRSFKTEVRLRQALKPFLSAGVVLGGLTAASMLMLR